MLPIGAKGGSCMTYIAHRAREHPPGIPQCLSQLLRDLRDQGEDLIDLGWGGPNRLPAPHVLASVIDGCHAEDAFCSPHVLSSLPEALVEWHRSRFGVSLDRDTEVLPVWGTLEGLLAIPLAFLESGDGLLVPNPGNPQYAFLPSVVDGVAVPYVLSPSHDFLPFFDNMTPLVTPRVRALILQLPSDPTATVGSLDTLRQALSFCRRHDLVLIHDRRLGEITDEGSRSPSVLEIPGAREIAVEFGSFTHTFHMAGARLGYFVGGEPLIAALGRTRGPCPLGPFLPIQRAAIHALTHGDRDAAVEGIRVMYRERRNALLQALASVGWTIPPSPCTLYVWAPVPGEGDDVRFVEHCLREAGVIFTPGQAFGDEGRGYVRMDLSKEELPRLMALGDRLASALQTFLPQ